MELTPIERAAEDYQSRGWPTVYINRIAIDADGKKVLEGVEAWEKATADMPVQRPGSSAAEAVGVRTGSISGVMLVDVDGDCPRWDALLAEHGEPETWTVETRSFGKHYGFAWDERMERFTKNDTGLALHKVDDIKMGAVDLRANGRIVFAPPSSCSDGTGYRIEDESDPIPMPDWLFETLCSWQDEKEAQKKKSLAAVTEAVEVNIDESDVRLRNALGMLLAAQDGDKHSTLNRSCFIIGGLAAGGILTKERAVELVQEACRANGRFPFDHHQRNTMIKALREGFNSPLGASVDNDINDLVGFNNPSIRFEAPSTRPFGESDDEMSPPDAKTIYEDEGDMPWYLADDFTRANFLTESKPLYRGMGTLMARVNDQWTAFDKAQIDHMVTSWLNTLKVQARKEKPDGSKYTVIQRMVPTATVTGIITRTVMASGMGPQGQHEEWRPDVFRGQTQRRPLVLFKTRWYDPQRNQWIEPTNDYMTLRKPVDYDPAPGPTPMLDLILRNGLADPAQRRLYGLALRRIFQLENGVYEFRGDGGTGKGMTVKILKAAFGQDSVGVLSMADLERDSHALEDVADKPFIVFEEMESSKTVSPRVIVAWLKKLSDGQVRINPKNKTAYTEDFKRVVIVLSNEDDAPLPDQGKALFRRFTSVHFQRSEDYVRQADMEEQLPAEAAAIAHRVLFDQAWEISNEDEANALREAALDDHDRIRKFVREDLILGDGYRESADDLRDALALHLEGDAPHRSAHLIRKTIKDLFGVTLQVQKSNGRNYTLGVGLKAESRAGIYTNNSLFGN